MSSTDGGFDLGDISAEEFNAAFQADLDAIVESLERIANELDDPIRADALRTILEALRQDWDFTAPHRTRTALLIALGTLSAVYPCVLPGYFAPALLMRQMVFCFDANWLGLEACSEDIKDAVAHLRPHGEAIAQWAARNEERAYAGETAKEELPQLIADAKALAEGIHELKETRYPTGISADIAALGHCLAMVAKQELDRA